MAQLFPEQIAAGVNANLDILFNVTGDATENVEKLIDLNRQTTRSALITTQEYILNALSVRDPQTWLVLQMSLVAPVAEKTLTYSRELFGIVSAAHAEFTRRAQAQSELYVRRMQTLVADVVKNAQAGSEAAVAAWKSATASTSTFVDTLQKAGQQAVEVAPRNLEPSTSAAAKTARRAIEQASLVGRP